MNILLKSVNTWKRAVVCREHSVRRFREKEAWIIIGFRDPPQKKFEHHCYLFMLVNKRSRPAKRKKIDCILLLAKFIFSILINAPFPSSLNSRVHFTIILHSIDASHKISLLISLVYWSHSGVFLSWKKLKIILNVYLTEKKIITWFSLNLSS